MLCCFVVWYNAICYIMSCCFCVIVSCSFLCCIILCCTILCYIVLDCIVMWYIHMIVVVVHLHLLILIVYILIDKDIIILLFFSCGSIVFLSYSVMHDGSKWHGSITMIELYILVLVFKAYIDLLLSWVVILSSIILS